MQSLSRLLRDLSYRGTRDVEKCGSLAILAAIHSNVLLLLFLCRLSSFFCFFCRGLLFLDSNVLESLESPLFLFEPLVRRELWTNLDWIRRLRMSISTQLSFASREHRRGHKLRRVGHQVTQKGLRCNGCKV